MGVEREIPVKAHTELAAQFDVWDPKVGATYTLNVAKQTLRWRTLSLIPIPRVRTGGGASTETAADSKSDEGWGGANDR